MNVKFGLMAGAAIACAVMAGCKAPKAQSPSGTTIEPTRPVRHTELVTVDEKPAQKAEKPAPFTKAPKAPPRCTCAPGTTHDKPCTCGAPNCKCKVAAPEPEYTVYRVKSGDMLSAICKTYGVRQKKVLELNGEHPAFAALQTAFAEDKERAAKLSKILLAQAKLIADIPLDDPSAYAELVCGLF